VCDYAKECGLMCLFRHCDFGLCVFIPANSHSSLLGLVLGCFLSMGICTALSNFVLVLYKFIANNVWDRVPFCFVYTTTLPCDLPFGSEVGKVTCG
jgi:hypothetical protein